MKLYHFRYYHLFNTYLFLWLSQNRLYYSADRYKHKRKQWLNRNAKLTSWHTFRESLKNTWWDCWSHHAPWMQATEKPSRNWSGRFLPSGSLHSARQCSAGCQRHWRHKSSYPAVNFLNQSVRKDVPMGETVTQPLWGKPVPLWDRLWGPLHKGKSRPTSSNKVGNPD